jgi:GTP-binding protein
MPEWGRYVAKPDDLVVNVCKRKPAYLHTRFGSDDALRLVPPRILSLEQAIETLRDDELLEVTPNTFRIRKRELDHAQRMRDFKKSQIQG